jgi:hypothetical protein
VSPGWLQMSMPEMSKILTATIRDRRYVFKNIFAQKLKKKWRFSLKITAI